MSKPPFTIPTAEPFFFPGDKTGCLLVHGFTGTPKEMIWLGEDLAKRGHTVMGIRLAGHATRPEDMIRTKWQDWLVSVEDGLNYLKGFTKHQIIMGLSMGGVLALLAASRYQINGAVAISAPCDLPKDPRLPFAGLLAILQPRIEKDLSDFYDKEAEKIHVDYPYYPTRSILQLIEVIKELRISLPDIQVPVMFVQSHGDHSIPAESMDYFFERVNSPIKEKLWVENSGHVVIREPDRLTVFEEISKFIERIT
jgi:carboxylesterase